MAYVNILIVEDEHVIALDMKRQLVTLGYNVQLANSADAAFDIAAKTQLDLVLMDIRIRGEMDGITAATQLQSRFNLPIVYVTAHADAATLEQAKATQPFGYVVKPFDFQSLSTAVEIALSRHAAESTIQKSLQRERELKELKSRLMTIVSHELRNPLSAIQFTLDLLERDDIPLEQDRRHRCIRRARTAVEVINQLLDEILILSEVEAGELTCRLMPLDLSEFCRELVNEFQLVTPEHTLVFQVSGCPPETRTLYRFDEKLLRYILTNLLSNAIKYSPQGGEVRLELIWEPQTVTLQIHDRGIGIAAVDHSKLFEPFQRGSNVGSIPGTGLGLSIVQQCVKTHQGTIAVESAIDIGTTFTVTLKYQ
ncbi:response regulator [Leptolyngbya sp. FACHB-36]|uniref:hybrid sensor histidine kinase/response regulator n=1 Tax=Leptolyngbya sp. FACHB-36 TaxID=2692808 RepID=UPI0016819DD5|nr:ATP-binding protein [Leptolyngbya sp. FACHB-36]MBD2018878.1 response regulator [Leptolyngbya sp. FACHB-36]